RPRCCPRAPGGTRCPSGAETRHRRSGRPIWRRTPHPRFPVACPPCRTYVGECHGARLTRLSGNSHDHSRVSFAERFRDPGGRCDGRLCFACVTRFLIVREKSHKMDLLPTSEGVSSSIPIARDPLRTHIISKPARRGASSTGAPASTESSRRQVKAREMMTTPGPRGLYRPEYEHDSCGVAFVVDMHGRRSRDIVEKALAALANLEHRGAVGAETNTGDGTGLMIQIPDRFLREIMREEHDVELPEAGAYATGLCFLPQSRMLAMDAERMVERIAAGQGVTVIGWREVPVDDSSVGAIARDAQPRIVQIFVRAAGPGGAPLTDLALERKCFVVRKRCEHELGSKGAGRGDLGSETVYFPSLSPRTFVYKGMLTETQLPDFYVDLRDQRVESALGIVHSRFSPNTLPAWPLAHPFRYVAHNGEINTARGNENRMRARESLMESEEIEDLSAALPICTPGGSDTARFDEALELLTLAGRPLPHAVLMMVPEAWERQIGRAS